MTARLGYYIIVLPLSYLPLQVLYVFTDIFYLLLITCIPYRKSVIQGNIDRSFPMKSEKEKTKIRRQFYRHFTDLLAEGVKNLSISKKELLKRFEVENPEIMQDLHSKGKDVILVSGHYNNWEWLITAQALLFKHKAFGIGMPLTSRFWDSKINERRERFGLKVVNAANYRNALKSNTTSPKVILTLADQSPGDANKSYWLNFLNQKTPVLFGTEMMAHEFNCAVVFFATEKIKRGHYRMKLSLISDEPKEMAWGQITEAHTSRLEQEIVRHPQYWLWSHKRWKRDVPNNLEQLKLEQNEKFNKRFNL
jgi:KDO2-lipid IV(A) lauroyltransferase